MKPHPRAALAIAVLLLGRFLPAAAQQPQNERLVTADGVRLDFPPDGVWRLRAQAVAARRARLRSQGAWTALNAPAVAGATSAAGAAVAGDLFAPAILIGYSDTDTSASAPSPLPRRVQYDSIFYTTQPLAGRPYTQRTFYEEMSHGLLHIRGQVYGWKLGSSPMTYYLEACGPPPTNALDCSAGRQHMYQLFKEALAAMDADGVDFGQFDNDGPDGIPNSPDDDGIVDVVQFVQPVVGGECGGRGVWAHKFTLAGLGGYYVTKTLRPNGQLIKVGPYHIIGGVGGVSCSATDTIMGIGTASHELGHGFGLPDLYDISGQTQGIGEWGLMGSANYRSLVSPGHMDAWCKDQLGWVVERPLAATGAYTLGPVVSGDTVMLVRPRGPNPRGEYYLLENKQALGSDVANMTFTCQSCPPSKNGGLLVWHIDSLKVATAGFDLSNSVNAGLPHGVALVQADGLGQLDKVGGNRGDGGDPYPGSFNNTAFSRLSAPAAINNSDGGFAGFALTKVNQDVPGGQMSFQLTFATVIRPSDTLAVVFVSGAAYHRFYDVLSQDNAVTVSAPSADTSADGRARFTFNSWSDGGAQTHQVTAVSLGDSLIAAMDARYQLKVAQAGTGAIAPSPPANLTDGEFFAAGTVITLIATSGPDSVFDSWSGDTTSTRDTLVLTMRRPYTLSGRFVPVLSVGQEAPPAAIMGALYQYQLPAQGGTGTYIWSVLGGQAPPGIHIFTDGRITGTPEATGGFDLNLQVTSGSQVLAVPVRLSVVAPTVVLDAVVHQLLRLDATLTQDQVRYFDLLGNRNNKLDLGDFLAWVKATGIKPSAEVMARVLAAPREAKP